MAGRVVLADGKVVLRVWKQCLTPSRFALFDTPRLSASARCKSPLLPGNTSSGLLGRSAVVSGSLIKALAAVSVADDDMTLFMLAMQAPLEE